MLIFKLSILIMSIPMTCALMDDTAHYKHAYDRYTCNEYTYNKHTEIIAAVCRCRSGGG